MRSWERERLGEEEVVARIIVGGKSWVFAEEGRGGDEGRGEIGWMVLRPTLVRSCSDHLTDDHESILACKPKGTLYAVNNVLGLTSRFLRHVLFGDA